jgi:hypothetical protein
MGQDDNEVDSLISSAANPNSTHRRPSNILRSKRSFAKLGCTVLLFSCITYYFGFGDPKTQTNQNHRTYHHTASPSPIFIFGHSTGHSGTGTFHQSIIQPGCPWNTTVEEFEYVAEGEKKWQYDGDCALVERELIPHLLESVGNRSGDGRVAYVDLGTKVCFIYYK